MKPERIQVTAPIQKPTPTWGIYQTFDFASSRKAANFLNVVTDMAENHGRDGVTCKLDGTRLTLFVPADVNGQLTASAEFVGEVVAIFELWSGPVAES